jgi:predicted RNA-binding Zn ribbon-like protein
VSRVSPHLPGFVAGNLCLDFVNTVDPRHADDRDDYLRDYGRLLDWSVAAGLIEPAERSDLDRRARADPLGADRVYQRALRLREALYRLLAPGSSDNGPSDRSAAQTFNDEIRGAWGRAAIEPTQDGWEWAWDDASSHLDRVLWPIARAAAELLTSPAAGRIRECEGSNGCGWLFIDASKNGRRRWCDMRVCGNRAKARRHSQRQRAVPHPDASSA